MTIKIILTIGAFVIAIVCLAREYTNGVIIGMALFIYNGLRVEIEFLKEHIDDLNK